jgi:DNA topoisomerase-3
MKLIIAEKPTQAQIYAKVLGNFNKKDGYLENNEYYITWCYGHLISLEKDDAYREKGSWNKSYLPLIPTKYTSIPSEKIKMEKLIRVKENK